MRLSAATRLFQIAVPTDFAFKVADACLGMNLNQQPQARFHGCLLSAVVR